MDYWLTPQWNEICIHESMNQAEPSTGTCDTTGDGYNNGHCLTADQLADASLAAGALNGGNGSVRGAGCKNDGGPLWISIPILDDPVVAGGSQTSGTASTTGGNPYPMSIWARFFQKTAKNVVVERKKPRISSYNNPERYSYSSRYESVGRDRHGYYPRLSSSQGSRHQSWS